MSAANTDGMTGSVGHNAAEPIVMTAVDMPTGPVEPIRYINYPLIHKPECSSFASESNSILEQVDTPLADALREEFWIQQRHIVGLYDSWKSDHDQFRAIFNTNDENLNSDAIAVAQHGLMSKQQQWAQGDASYQHWRSINPAVEIIINSIKEEMRLYPIVSDFFQSINSVAPSDEREQLAQEISAKHRDLWNIRIRAQIDANTMISNQQQSVHDHVMEDQHQQGHPTQLGANAGNENHGLDVVAAYVYADSGPQGSNQPDNAGAAHDIEM
ncbi:hypothetical protein QBC38DRAFT_156349 [Podospora fimiseda]|uniref:Uncharacterized protein n=1 Tax=Podospora fimiseda TaxID=252190 RepID=A0AAN7BRW9_9PEZI|nr:hypothetical protein QBC38DRAFT_156349 [Podospora fimiseda]